MNKNRNNDITNGCFILLYPAFLFLCGYGAYMSEGIFMWIVFGAFCIPFLIILLHIGSGKSGK